MWKIIKFLGSTEFLVWIGITFLFLWYNRFKERFFQKNTVIKDANAKIMELRKVKYKSLDEQKQFLRAKNDSGKDFINVVVSMILFILVFKYIFIPRMPSLYIGLGTVVIVSLAAAFVNSLMYSENSRQYQFVSSFLGFTYGGTLFLYLHFVNVEYPIMLFIGIILLFIFAENLFKKIKED